MTANTTKLKLLIVTRNFPPEICGVGDHSAVLMESLIHHGIEVKIFTRENPTVKEYVKQKKWQNRVFMGDWNSWPSIYESIKAICQQHCIDTVFWQYVPYAFARKGLPIFLPFLMLALKLVGIRQIVYFHEVAIRRKNRGIKKFIWSCLQRLLAWSLCAISQKRLTNSNFHKGYLQPFKSSLIPVGANIFFLNAHKVIVKKNEPVIIFAFTSRITAIMLSAIRKEFLQKGIDFRLEIAGRATSAELNQLVHCLKNQTLTNFTNLHGMLDNSVLAQLINNCDIFVHAEPEEHFGEGGVSTKNGTVIAAMAMAKPIISTLGDLTDQSIFINGQNILLAGYSDENSWTEALRSLKAPEFRFSLGQRAYQTWGEQFSWEVVSTKIASVLHG